MKTVLFFLVLFLIVSCSEDPNDVANMKAPDYFPLIKGSHWTYSVTDFDSLGNPTMLNDSEYVSVTACNFIGDKSVYLLSINSPQFVKGKTERIWNYANIGFDGSDLQIFGKALNPFLPLDTASCMSHMPERWINMSRFSKQQWALRVSFLGDIFPTLTVKVDSVTHDTTWVNGTSETAWIYTLNANRENDEQISINGTTYNTIVHSFSGQRIYRIVYPENVQLVRDPDNNYKYIDSGRAAIQNEFTLKLWYAKGIGIVKSEGRLMRGIKQIYYRRKELGSYYIK